MFRKQTRTKFSLVLTASLLSSLLLPTPFSYANAGTDQQGDQMPVLRTVPEANAKTVRPDTDIELQLDTSSADFKQWNKRFQDKEVTLELVNDGGQAFYTAADSELRYDPISGKLTFTPPNLLMRYTTYDVVISPDKLPDAKLNDPDRKKLPKRPDFKIEPVDVNQLLKTKPASREVTVNGQDGSNLIGNSATDVTSQQTDSSVPAQSVSATDTSADAAPTLVGPTPVHPVSGGLKPIQAKDGDSQDGIIERIDGNQITLFGGVQFEVTADTHIQIPDLPGHDTLQDLHPGDFVSVDVNASDAVTNVHVKNRKDVLSFVFQTGSDLHEPTHVSLQQQEYSPRVTDDGHFSLISTDDYGLPAYGSTVQVDLATTDGTALDASAAVLPSSPFVTSNQTGQTDVTVVDHRPQDIVAIISMNGPYLDGLDAKGFTAYFHFRPGLPALAKLQAPDQMTVATSAALTGSVTDVYGNAVEDGAELDFTASQGAIDSPVYTLGGRYSTSYTAPTKVQDVTVQMQSVAGTANAQAVIHLLPGDPAQVTLTGPNQVQAGDTVTMQGMVTDKYGNLVLDGSVLHLLATAGDLPSDVTTTNGAYQFSYTAPTKVQTVDVSVTSDKGTAFVDNQITIIPGPPAIMSLQAQNTSLFTGDTTGLSGQVEDRYENLIPNQQVSLKADHGKLSNQNPTTNELGLYNSIYTAPFYNGVDNVYASAGQANATLQLNISSAGSGLNPVTGQVEPVASIVFDKASYAAAPNQVLTLTGHAFDAAGQPLQGVVFSAQSASAGTITFVSQSDATGLFTVTYQAPASQAVAVVKVNSNLVCGQTTVNTFAYGYGYNPVSGQWESIGSITLDTTSYQQSFNGQGQTQTIHSPAMQAPYHLNLFPSSTYMITGHVYDVNGQPLSQVQFDTVKASAGTLQVTQPTDADGAFTLTYNTPTTEGNQSLQIGSGNVILAVAANISSVGMGYNINTGAAELVSNIVLNPTTYTANAGGTVTITGTVTDSAGTPLKLAKLLVSVNGGTAPSQIISAADGSFSLSYTAPNQAGAFNVHVSVSSSIFGDATVNVSAPKPPYWLNPNITLYGSFYDTSYGTFRWPRFQGTVYWSGQLMNGDGTPRSYSLYQNMVVLDVAVWNHYGINYPDANGWFSGSRPYAKNADYYSINTYYGGEGITYYYFVNFYLGAMGTDNHYTKPDYFQKSYFLRDYEYVNTGYYW